MPTGEVKAPPCAVALRTYKVMLNGDDVLVDLDRDAAGAKGQEGHGLASSDIQSCNPPLAWFLLLIPTSARGALIGVR